MHYRIHREGELSQLHLIMCINDQASHYLFCLCDVK